MKKNPFIISPEITSKYFCNRNNEIEDIIKSFRNKQNTFLFSRKGLGKTALVKQVVKSIKSEKDIESYYINISEILNIQELLDVLANHLFQEGHKKDFFKVRNNSELLSHLSNIFNEFDNRKRIIIIDDFQQIITLLSSEILQQFLLITEKLKSIQFIFCGNEREIVSLIVKLNIHNNSKYNFIKLEPIDPKVYRNFIRKMFRKSGIKIKKESVQYILSLTNNHSYFTQYFCSRLFALKNKEIAKKDINSLFNQILLEKEIHFLTYKDLLSSYQWKLICAIANEGIAKQITSGEFIRKYALNAPSYVKTAEKSLLEKNIIVKNKTGYQLADVFLEKWLSSKNQ